jgi:hypothetical protein
MEQYFHKLYRFLNSGHPVVYVKIDIEKPVEHNNNYLLVVTQGN